MVPSGINPSNPHYHHVFNFTSFPDHIRHFHLDTTCPRPIPWLITAAIATPAKDSAWPGGGAHQPLTTPLHIIPFPPVFKSLMTHINVYYCVLDRTKVLISLLISSGETMVTFQKWSHLTHKWLGRKILGISANPVPKIACPLMTPGIPGLGLLKLKVMKTLK